MSQNPALVEALAKDRLAELHQATRRCRRETRPRRVIRAARNETGWLLVDLGLRLAVPRGAIRVGHADR